MQKNNKNNNIIYILSVCLVNSLIDNNKYFPFTNELLPILLAIIPSLCKASRYLFIRNCPNILIVWLIENNHMFSDLYNKLPISFYPSLTYSRYIFGFHTNNYFTKTLNKFLKLLASSDNVNKVLCLRDYISTENNIYKNTNNNVTTKVKEYDDDSYISYYLLKKKCISITPEKFFSSQTCIEAMKDKNVVMLKKYFLFVKSMIKKKTITPQIIKHMKHMIILSISKTTSTDIKVSSNLNKIVYDNNPLFIDKHYFIDAIISNEDEDDNVNKYNYDISDNVHVELLMKLDHCSSIFKPMFKKHMLTTSSIDMIRFYIGQTKIYRCVIQDNEKLVDQCKKVLRKESSSNDIIAIETINRCNYLESQCECITFEQFEQVLKLYYSSKNNKALLEFLEHYTFHFNADQIMVMLIETFKNGERNYVNQHMLLKKVCCTNTRMIYTQKIRENKYYDCANLEVSNDKSFKSECFNYFSRSYNSFGDCILSFDEVNFIIDTTSFGDNEELLKVRYLVSSLYLLYEKKSELENEAFRDLEECEKY